ncbi:FecR domain-containing protein [Fulvivirgaceae bacterium BMA10]|uniref:FecR domain-containing protein n=1 Tax=Splendidivirga corallicola TaxID=3051826 RepID=A0ABT8KQ86_9BACT|nr:FecR domain-containing protein [Fulvivirgaceae bacterium BMA10]
MDYRGYKLLDFLMDEDFQQWVLFPTQTSDVFWDKVIRKDPDKKVIIDQAKAILGSIDYKKTGISELDKKSILTDVQARINAERLKEKPVASNKYVASEVNEDNNLSAVQRLARKKERARFLRGIAATLIGMVIVASALYFSGSQSQETETIAVEYLEKSSLKGEKSNIKLSDGTKIKLNSNSKLIIPKQFSDHERKIELIGEAYFEVSKDASRPFIITSNDIKTVVLGTSFNVRAYPSENTIQVAVAEGKVSVEKITEELTVDQDPILLSPNEMAVYSKETHIANKELFEPIEVFAWKDGILYFKDADIYEAIEKLEQWYGVTFIIKTQLNEDKDLSGSFKNRSLEAVLDGLSYVFGFDFKIDGKVVTLK